MASRYPSTAWSTLRSNLIGDSEFKSCQLYWQIVAGLWECSWSRMLPLVLWQCSCKHHCYFLLSQVDIYYFLLVFDRDGVLEKTSPANCQPPPPPPPPLFYTLYFWSLSGNWFGPPYLGKATAAARAELPSPTRACWVFSCFRNPPNSDMNCMQDL